ncbi:hypothetical protein CHLNCDRAFT_59197 [Chlorella variabilis]|uniref:Uncharacterized protein n=1 Tax=Chlorella variabilis TaxID=554065 RepID=E1ZRJ8_CHLVA|nr:hypothetical protein CHLNCDRAFT_59197 [Chlorella variabilis]EFN51583.1 hypothetical protein CHLNCDRAFT_59197 [Chlorella variabilis]|eukprot:XP_005843685.1 hypothetical protein CHLNCDRAFT_59197 [Chlorella variabilis]
MAHAQPATSLHAASSRARGLPAAFGAGCKSGGEGSTAARRRLAARRFRPLAASVTEHFGVEDWPAVQQLLAAAGGDHLARLRAVLAVRPDLVAARTWAPASPDDVASGYSALHFAAAGDNVECLAALLAAGADVRARDDRGATALHWCAAAVASLDHEGSCGLCLRALIAAGADVDARDEDGETALHCAARLGNLAAIRCLAEAGAYLGAANLEGESPQIVARNHCKWEAAVLLGQLQAELDGALVQEGAPEAECVGGVWLSEFPVDEWSEEAQLIAAASAGDLRRLRAVLASRPELVDARTALPCSVASGYSALHFAAFNGHMACVRALLAAGADVRARDDRGATALHWAAGAAGALARERGGEPCLRQLVGAGADVDARDEDGETALHCAARLGNLVAIRCLAEAGAYLGAANLEGVTPRILARNCCKYEAAELLGQLQAELEAQMGHQGPGLLPGAAQQSQAVDAEQQWAAGLFGPELVGAAVRVWWAEREEFMLGHVTSCAMPDRVHTVRFDAADLCMRWQRVRLQHELVEVQRPDGSWARFIPAQLQRQGSAFDQ